MSKNSVVSRRLFCGGAAILLAESAIGCHHHRSNTGITDPFYGLQETVNPGMDLQAQFSSTYAVSGVNYDFGSGSVSQGVIGQVVLHSTGQLSGTLRDFLNSSSGYTEAQKDALMTALVLETPVIGGSFNRTITDTTTSDFTGTLAVVNTIKQNDTSTGVEGVMLSWGTGTRQQIRLAVFQQYVDKGMFDPDFVTKIKAGALDVYTDTIEIGNINLSLKFTTTTTDVKSAGVQGHILKAIGTLNYSVTNNVGDDAVIGLATSSPTVIAVGKTLGAALITTRATTLSILGIGTQPHYAAGANVRLTSQLLTTDGSPVARMSIVLSLFYIRNYAPLTNRYTAYTGTTDADGKFIFDFQLPESDEDYAMVATFAGSETYNASQSYVFTLLVGN